MNIILINTNKSYFTRYLNTIYVNIPTQYYFTVIIANELLA